MLQYYETTLHTFPQEKKTLKREKQQYSTTPGRKNLENLSSDYLSLQRTPSFHPTSDKQKITSKTQIRRKKYIQSSKLGFIM